LSKIKWQFIYGPRCSNYPKLVLFSSAVNALCVVRLCWNCARRNLAEVACVWSDSCTR